MTCYKFQTRSQQTNLAHFFNQSDPVEDLKLDVAVFRNPWPPKGTAGWSRQCLHLTTRIKTSISTRINRYKGQATVVTCWLLHGSHFQIYFPSPQSLTQLYDLWNSLTSTTVTYPFCLSVKKRKPPTISSNTFWILSSPAPVKATQ